MVEEAERQGALAGLVSPTSYLISGSVASIIFQFAEYQGHRSRSIGRTVGE
jgi:hypothetical protein